MPTLINTFRFTSPKTVTSGSSITLNVEVTVTGGPRSLALEAPTGYTLSPSHKTFADGDHQASIPLIISGPKGSCPVEGLLGDSTGLDVVEVK
jgi:hypothetical protein